MPNSLSRREAIPPPPPAPVFLANFELSLGIPESEEHPGEREADLPGREAIGAFRRAAEGEPGDPDYFYMLGCALARQGRHPDAVVALREALATPGAHPSYRRALGESLWRLSSFEEAADAFAQVLREDPADAEAANGLGLSLLRLGRAKEAVQALRSALQAGGSRTDWLTNLGAALMAAGDPAESERLLRRAVAARPGDPAPRRNLGRALLARGQQEEALDCFREVLRLTGAQDAAAHMDLGDALFAAGRHEDAEAAYEQGVSLEPSAATSREGSRTAWQAIRLRRAQRELEGDRGGRLGTALFSGALGAAHASKPWLAYLGRTTGRRVGTVVVMIGVLIVGRGAIVLLPHYVAHHRLYDEIVRLAREPNYDDDKVREETLRALHTYGRDRYVRPDDVRVEGRHQIRHVDFGYTVPMALLPGITTTVPFRIAVEEPWLAEPDPVIL